MYCVNTGQTLQGGVAAGMLTSPVEQTNQKITNNRQMIIVTAAIPAAMKGECYGLSTCGAWYWLAITRRNLKNDCDHFLPTRQELLSLSANMPFENCLPPEQLFARGYPRGILIAQHR